MKKLFMIRERRKGPIVRAQDGEIIYFSNKMEAKLFLAPTLRHRLLAQRVSPAVSIKDLATSVELPRVEQNVAVFGYARPSST